jgi:hypothetical protein
MSDLKTSKKSLGNVDNGEIKTFIITTNNGNGLKFKIKAYKYIECSALTQANVNQVFEACICAFKNFKLSKRKKSSSISLFSCFRSQTHF